MEYLNDLIEVFECFWPLSQERTRCREVGHIPTSMGNKGKQAGGTGGWTDDGRGVVDDGSPQRRKGGTGVGDAVRGQSEWEIEVRSMEQGAMSARDGPGTARDPATEVGRQVDQ